MPLTGLGSEPSVVYLIEATPEPASVAESATVTELVYQPAEQAPALQVTEVAGAVPSAVTVNGVLPLGRPALFVALTLFGSTGSTAEELKVYASSVPLGVPLQPVPSAGNEREAIPDWRSLAAAVTVNPPAAPVRK